MSFVFPALLGGLVLAGIPVLLHLILRQQPKTLPFPAFRFLVARHRTNQRKLQLRHWLLLALRMMLLAGLILAVARPRLLQRSLGISSERPVAVVLVFDTSASMDYRSSDNRSRLDDAKARALELVAELPPGSRIAVVESGEVRARVDWTENTSQVRTRIQALKVDPASPSLPRVLVAALGLLHETATAKGDEMLSRLPRLLAVFSDTTRGAWDVSQLPSLFEASDRILLPRETLQEARANMGPILKLLEEAKQKLAVASSPDFPHASLSEALTELRDLIPRLGPSEFPLKDRPLQLVQQARQAARQILPLLSSTPGEKESKEDFHGAFAKELRLLLHHLTGYRTLWMDVGMNPPRDLAILDIEWPRDRMGAVQESLQPGETLLLKAAVQALGQDFQTKVVCKLPKGVVTIPLELKSGERREVPIEIDTGPLGPGAHAVEWKLESADALEVNNRRWATFVVREPKKVLILAETPARAEDDFARALRANLFQVETKSADDLTGPVPVDVQTVYLFGVSAPSESLWRRLDAFTRRGGGLGIFPGGEEMKIAAYYGDAARAIVPAQWKEVAVFAKSVDKEPGVAWDLQTESIGRHLLFRPFSDWLRVNDYAMVLKNARAFRIWATDPEKGAETLVRYQDPTRRPAVVERKMGAGKVLQFTTPFDLRQPEWNNYVQSWFYTAVVGLTTRYLTGDLDAIHVNFLLGREEPVVTLPVSGGKLWLRGPRSLDPLLANAARVSVPQANLPGVYWIQDETQKVKAGFSVNLPPTEVDVSPLAPGEVENVFGAESVVSADRRADLRDLLSGHWSEPVELFPYFMIALLLLLAIENLLANRFYRSDAN